MGQKRLCEFLCRRRPASEKGNDADCFESFGFRRRFIVAEGENDLYANQLSLIGDEYEWDDPHAVLE